MGFLFLVLYPPLPSHNHSLTHSHTHTHTLTHTLTHSHTHSLTHPLTHSLTHSLTHTHSHTHTLTHSLTHSFTHSLTHAPTHSLTHPLTHSHTHTHSLTHSPTHPLTHSPTHPLTHSPTHSLTHPLTHSPTHPLTHSPTHPPTHSLTHSRTHARTHALTHSLNSTQLTHSTHSLNSTHSLTQLTHSLNSLTQLTHSTHSLTQLTHSLTPSLTHSLTQCAFCVACVGQCGLPRARMYALASLGSPPLLRGRRGTMCTAKGSDVRPGVPWVSASFAWQAWDNVHCQGVECTPWRPLGLRRFCVAGVGHVHCQGLGCTPWRPLGLRRFCVAGVGQCACQGLGCTPWRPLGLRLFGVAGVAQCARMYALASLGSPPLLRGRRGTMCTAKGSDVRPGVPWVSASLAWQAWHNVHCQGLGCTPWRPLGLRLFCVAGVGQCALPRARMYALASLGSPPLLRGRRGTMCTAKGWDVRPGVPWVSASFAWQAWHNVHCQGLGCTPWRPLGLRLFCVAGVGQCALPRARMYALASLGSLPLWRGRRGTMCTAKGSDVRPGVPWVSAAFAWQAWQSLTHSLTH